MAKTQKPKLAAVDREETVEAKAPVKRSPNADLDLSGFTYEGEIKGDDWERYKSQVSKLRQNDMYDFVLLRTVPIRVERYPGMKGSPVELVGLRIKDTTPVHVSRISVADAIRYNSQIENEHSIAGHGKYYFLKK